MQLGRSSTYQFPSLDTLSLEEKIGQMLCLGWGGEDSYLAVNAQARECIRDLHAGGVIVMGRNVQPDASLSGNGGGTPTIDAEGVLCMIRGLQTMAKVPLLVGTDQEGGRVARFGAAPFTRMPSARTIGASGDLGIASRAAWATGRELAAVGVNWDFAPEADVDSNPDNPVIADRAFASSAETVASMVAAQIAGYEAGGVLACAKHFPGHGDTSVDSHLDLPTLPFGLAAMEARELVPFRAAIDASIPSLMTAHIRFPAVDPSGLPATLSRPILTGLLREKMGFAGLVVTDCLQMRAVADHWGTPRAAVLAAIAGADMLLICHTLESQRAARAALLAAAKSGELPAGRIDQAVARVFAAKARALALAQPNLDVIGSLEHQEIRRAIVGDAPTPYVATTLGAEAPA